jgi:hypothetical protein
MAQNEVSAAQLLVIRQCRRSPSICLATFPASAQATTSANTEQLNGMIVFADLQFDLQSGTVVTALVILAP